MTYQEQHLCPSWIDDDNWTNQKTDWELDYLMVQSDHRELTAIEKLWLQSLFTLKENVGVK